MAEKLAIQSRGQGPDLVLIHGWAMHSGIWAGMVDQIATGYRVHLVDLPGHGVNGNTPLSGDLDEVAELIAMALPPAIWVGWSLGGLVTLAVALRHPHQVQKAIMVSATPCFSKQPDWQSGVSTAQQRAFIDGFEQDLHGTLDQFYLQCFGATWLTESLDRLGYKSKTGSVPSAKVLQAGLHLLYGSNLLPALHKCDVPTLFLGGTRDRIIRPESFGQAAAMMPAGRSRLIRAAGHAPFISHPETFMDIIGGFVQGDGTG